MEKLNTLEKTFEYLTWSTLICGAYIFKEKEEYKMIILLIAGIFFVLYSALAVYKWLRLKKEQNN